MDAYEATKIVFQRIQKLDPENASKIMGLLLIQDHGEQEMIRLAFGPEALLQSVILKARKELGLATNSPSTPSTPSSPSPFSNHIPFSRQNSNSSTSSRFFGGVNLPSPLCIPNHASSFSDFQNHFLICPSASPVSYAAAVNNGITNIAAGSSSSTINSSASPFCASGEVDLIDELQLQDQLSFLNDGSPTMGPRNTDMFYPQRDLASSPNGASGEALLSSVSNWDGSVNGLNHRRSYSVSDMISSSDDPSGGLGLKPCLYFAKGYCKNGAGCRFLHGGLSETGPVDGDSAAMVSSPSKFETMEQSLEYLRSKAAQQQQRLAEVSQLMASTNFPYSSAAAGKCMNFLLQQQQLQANSPSRNRFDRGDFGINGDPGMVNPCSTQIYLTFPADSNFKEEDVSNYFSMYGPVQDVRIPYQQKRMFGFVTFVYPETVKIILAKGNPHFVCDARVLVKPYKEKGKVPDKHRKHQQQLMERGEFTGFGSPTGLESRDPYDLPLGARMFQTAQEMLWRRKLEEEADLQQAIELRNRRLLGLQLLDVKRNSHHRTLSTGAVISSPILSPSFFTQNTAFSAEQRNTGKSENGLTPVLKDQATDCKQEVQQTFNVTGKEKVEEDLPADNVENCNVKETPHQEDSNFPESLEHNLPDNPFASPKAAGEHITAFTNNSSEEMVTAAPAPATNNNLRSSSSFPPATSLDIAPMKSCYFEAPRYGS